MNISSGFAQKFLTSRKMLRLLSILFLFFFTMLTSCQQETKRQHPIAIGTKTPWHGIARKVRYQPDGESFVITNGTRRFNRALYGSDTGFRVEAGDLPEFAMYLPGYGGTVKLAIIKGNQSKWLIDADEIIARYVPGSMYYEVKDELLESGSVKIGIIPLYSGEGLLLKIDGEDLDDDIKIGWVYGGATGKKFSRDGDIGADPESVFYLTSENCATSEWKISANQFDYFYGDGLLVEDDNYENAYDLAPKDRKGRPIFKKHLTGSATTTFKVLDAETLENPADLFSSQGDLLPVVGGLIDNFDEAFYLGIFNPENAVKSSELSTEFDKADNQRKAIADRVKVKTPDPHINALGGALAIAADGVWENPSYQHGAIAWRKALVGWRGAYAADWLGWHDRARTHLSAYAKSQYTEPASGPSSPDPKTHLARQVEKKGTALFTSGYISRYPGKPNEPHHYDMNLVYIDALIRHIHWTGDKEYLKEMWPLLQRHFAWEARNFDPDNDGLYNAYASIWASDALNYNGGGVAHSSAYNFYALKWAAMMGKDLPEADAYQLKADQIKKALNDVLWMPKMGTYAEYKDNLGHKLLHPQTGVWSVYHLIDSEVPDAFQKYQLLRYVDTQIPQIPMVVEGMNDGYYTISTTNWMPYTWSVNNVALAETMHTALAYWQGGRSETGFNLFKSALMESMYNGASPGNFQQLSFYDAMRGELYRDFADPIAMTARGLVEGLFGVKPQMTLDKKLIIEPGFPADWKFAQLETPSVSVKYKMDGALERFVIKNKLGAQSIVLTIAAKSSVLKQLKNNVEPMISTSADIGAPRIMIEVPAGKDSTVFEVEWAGNALYDINRTLEVAQGTGFKLDESGIEILDIKDPQGVFENENWEIKDDVAGNKTIFALIKQDKLSWWEPINLNIVKPISLDFAIEQPANRLEFTIQNNYILNLEMEVLINGKSMHDVSLSRHQSKKLSISENLVPGTNVVSIRNEFLPEQTFEIVNWEVSQTAIIDVVDLASYYNDSLTNIFKNEYLSPRSPYPTLQLPIHGLGDWCSHGAYMEIDDSGLRSMTDANEELNIPNGIKFNSPKSGNNILFVSQWDNYPNAAKIPLSGYSSHAYLLMTGSTNPMQSRLDNGFVKVKYTDGSTATLSLRNPETWWPIEQDYYTDGYAFNIDYPKPYRVHLKTGWIGREFGDYVSIKSFTNYAIDGGAATVYDLPLDATKELESLEVSANAIDVVIGLMGVSLVR